MKKFWQKIKFKFQRAKKGYCDYDLYSIDLWFINIFPKMLNEFIECTCGCPCNEEELKEEVSKMSELWVEEQRTTINKLLKRFGAEFDLNDGFCCWLLILLRMKHCFELCDEFNNIYETYNINKLYKEKDVRLNIYKKEAFYLFEKYFYGLWW